MKLMTLHKAIETAVGKTGLSKLDKRQRHLVLAGGLFLACLALFHFAVSPLLNARQQTQKAVSQKKEDLIQIRQLQEEHRKLRNQAVDIESRLQKRSPSFSLFSFIEERATQAGVKQQISSMAPSTSGVTSLMQESRVDLKLEQVSLQQLVDFLQQVESTDDVVMIKRISIQGNSKEEATLDVVMHVITFTRQS